jgi:hypothetical protein
MDADRRVPHRAAAHHAAGTLIARPKGSRSGDLALAFGLHTSSAGRVAMLFLVVLLVVLWLLGLLTSATLGGWLHILLVIAIVLFLVHIIQGRSIGAA